MVVLWVVLVVEVGVCKEEKMSMDYVRERKVVERRE